MEIADPGAYTRMFKKPQMACNMIQVCGWRASSHYYISKYDIMRYMKSINYDYDRWSRQNGVQWISIPNDSYIPKVFNIKIAKWINMTSIDYYDLKKQNDDLKKQNDDLKKHMKRIHDVSISCIELNTLD